MFVPSRPPAAAPPASRPLVVAICTLGLLRGTWFRVGSCPGWPPWQPSFVIGPKSLWLPQSPLSRAACIVRLCESPLNEPHDLQPLSSPYLAQPPPWPQGGGSYGGIGRGHPARNHGRVPAGGAGAVAPIFRGRSHFCCLLAPQEPIHALPGAMEASDGHVRLLQRCGGSGTARGPATG